MGFMATVQLSPENYSVYRSLEEVWSANFEKIEEFFENQWSLDSSKGQPRKRKVSGRGGYRINVIVSPSRCENII